MKRLSYIILPLLGVWAALLATHIFLTAVVAPNKWLAQYSELMPIFSWIVALGTMLFWSIRTLRLFAWNTGRERFARLLMPCLMLFLLVVMPFSVVHSRVDIAESSLRELQTADELAGYIRKDDRYFALNTYYADIAHAGIYAEYYRGRSRSHPEVDAYIVCPIRNSAADTSALRSWLCIAYNKEIPLRERYKPSEQLVEEFRRECMAEFQTSDVGGFVYLERVRYAHDIELFGKAMSESSMAGKALHSVFFLEPVYKPFELRNEGAFGTVFGISAFGVGFIVFLLSMWRLHEENFRQHRAKVDAARQKWRRYFSFSR